MTLPCSHCHTMNDVDGRKRPAFFVCVHCAKSTKIDRLVVSQGSLFGSDRAREILTTSKPKGVQ